MNFSLIKKQLCIKHTVYIIHNITLYSCQPYTTSFHLTTYHIVKIVYIYEINYIMHIYIVLQVMICVRYYQAPLGFVRHSGLDFFGNT